jgi:LysM repeat protein
MAGSVISGAALAGCGSGTGSSGTNAALDVERWTGTTGLDHSTAHLDCGDDQSATSFLAHSASEICDRVTSGALVRIAARHRGVRECAQIFSGPQRAQIAGTVDGRKVAIDVNRSNSCQTADWVALDYLLGEPTNSNSMLEQLRSQIVSTTTMPGNTGRQYIVIVGDTLASIGAHFGVTPAQIAAANTLTHETLKVGQRLFIPDAGTTTLTTQPSHGPVGGAVTFTLRDARPGEHIQFFVKGPISQDGGPPHLADADGKVTATYTTGQIDNSAGVYGVEAVGDEGTFAVGSFVLEAANS